MTNTPSPTDEDRELIEMDRAVSKLVDLHKRLHGCFTSPTGVALPRRPRNLEPTMADCNATLAGMVELERAKDRLESLLSDRAKLEEALLVGTLSMTNTQVIADFDTREAAELFYERLAIVLLNRRYRPCDIGRS